MPHYINANANIPVAPMASNQNKKWSYFLPD